MTAQLLISGILGIATTAVAFYANRHLFNAGNAAGRVSLLEGIYYVVGVVSIVLGWYFNIRYVQHFGARASWIHFTKSLFSNWAADSEAQDYLIVSLVLFPLWTIIDGRRRGIRVPWMFFVMSLFTSLGFCMGGYLAFVERQRRYNRAFPSTGTPDAPDAAASSTA